MNIPQNSSKKKQTGFSFIEIAIGLVILALIASVLGPIGYKYLKNSEGDSAARTTESYFTDLAAKWRRAPYTGLNNAFAISAKLPEASVVSGTNILNYWGNNTVFEAGTLTGGVTDGAKQITDPVDPNACLRYVSYVSSFSDEVIVGSTTVKAVGGSLNNVTAATACDVTTTSVNVIMRKS